MGFFLKWFRAGCHPISEWRILLYLKLEVIHSFDLYSHLWSVAGEPLCSKVQHQLLLFRDVQFEIMGMTPVHQRHYLFSVGWFIVWWVYCTCWQSYSHLYTKTTEKVKVHTPGGAPVFICRFLESMCLILEIWERSIRQWPRFHIQVLS